MGLRKPTIANAISGITKAMSELEAVANAAGAEAEAITGKIETLTEEHGNVIAEQRRAMEISARFKGLVA